VEQEEVAERNELTDLYLQ